MSVQTLLKSTNSRSVIREVGLVSDAIKDLKDSRVKVSALFFYFWVMVRYQDRPFTIKAASKGYGRTRRTILRYLSDLREQDMMEKYSNANGVGCAEYRIKLD